MTVPSPLTPSTSIILATDTSDARVLVENATAWEVRSSWVDREGLIRGV